jgi:hypothetical protein
MRRCRLGTKPSILSTSSRIGYPQLDAVNGPLSHGSDLLMRAGKLKPPQA